MTAFVRGALATTLVAASRFIPSHSQKLLEHRASIEAEFGAALEWEPLEGKKSARIALYRAGTIEEAEEHAEYLSWCVEHLLKLKRAFGPRLLVP